MKEKIMSISEIVDTINENNSITSVGHDKKKYISKRTCHNVGYILLGTVSTSKLK